MWVVEDDCQLARSSGFASSRLQSTEQPRESSTPTEAHQMTTAVHRNIIIILLVIQKFITRRNAVIDGYRGAGGTFSSRAVNRKQ